jgi:hypothetical protein
VALCDNGDGFFQQFKPVCTSSMFNVKRSGASPGPVSDTSTRLAKKFLPKTLRGEEGWSGREKGKKGQSDQSGVME